jgi:hypothetical protein
MTASAVSPAVPVTRRALVRVGAVLAVVLALVDLAGVVMFLAAPVPLFINLTIAVLAVATVVGAVFAWRGARWGAWLAAITRALSIIPMLPVLVATDGVPLEAVIPTWIQLGVTVVTVALLVVAALRRGR